MPAKSKAQQHFMGLVYAIKKGKMKKSSTKVKKAAKHMTLKQVKDFAATSTKKLPFRKKRK